MKKSLESFEVVYSKTAVKEIKRLDPVIKKKLGKVIVRYSRNPLQHAKRLSSSELGAYRWRAGNYRIIFDVSGKTVQVLKVGHRRDIYKK